MSKDNPLLSVVVPVYNEQEVIAETAKRLRGVLDGMSVDYDIVFVNDGSRDGTLSVLRPLCEADARLKLVNFSRNFGHQIAITAGMDMTRGDAVVVIDADLQDPPEVIPGMFERWKQGYEVVYGKRLSREGETFFKKFTAKVFYRFMARMTEVDMPVDTGDFRLLDRKVVDALRRTPERNRYVRGIVSWLGFKQCAYEYERHERFAGQTKYPLKKMLKLACDGLVSFSVKPLRWIMGSGVVLSVLSVLYLVYILIASLCGVAMLSAGLYAMLGLIVLLLGVVMVFLGVLGEYIGRIYDESKARPLYLVSDTVNIEAAYER